MVTGAPVGRLEGWGGWNLLKSRSLTCLVLDVGSPPVAFPCGLGLSPIWQLGYKGKHSKGKRKPYIALYNLDSEITLPHFCNIQDSYKVCLGSRKGNVDPNGGVSVSLCKKSGMGYTLNVAIFVNYIYRSDYSGSGPVLMPFPRLFCRIST